MKSDKWKDHIYLSLGSNLGDRSAYLKKALGLIETQIGEIVQSSSIYETEAWGNKELKPFYNQVLRLKSKLSPLELLAACQQIEKALGRKRDDSGNYIDRTMDIDILFYGSAVIDESSLKVPHPHLGEREFVLVPLKEISPNFEHPIREKRISVMLADLSNIESVKKVAF